MKKNSLTYRSMSGFLWKLTEKAGSQVVSFVIQLVLARLLLPEVYGIVGYLTIFITLSDVFIKQGLTMALIQKKDADDTDFSSVFWTNLVVSLLLYAIMFVAAPYISIFYEEPQLTSVMRVLSLNVVIGALGAVHEAAMTKQLDFKKSFYRGLANSIAYGVSGVLLALNGFGVWSLVYGRLIGVSVGSAVLWLTVKWRPRFLFSKERVISLFRFGSKVLGTNLLNSLFNNINSLIIGKFGDTVDLGHYERGRNIPQTIMLSLDGSLSEVMYPTYSAVQDNLDTVKAYVRRSLKLSMYIVFPVLTGLAAVAEPLTLVLLTEKWLPSVPYMQLTCLICAFWPLSAREHALNALGRSDLTFKLSLISKIISVAFLIAFAQMGVMMIMWGTVFTSVICFFVVSYYVKKHLRYSIGELAQDLLPSLLLSLVMGGCVLAISLLKMQVMVQLVVQVLCGVAVYVLGSMLLRLDSFQYILNMLKQMRKK